MLNRSKQLTTPTNSEWSTDNPHFLLAAALFLLLRPRPSHPLSPTSRRDHLATAVLHTADQSATAELVPIGLKKLCRLRLETTQHPLQDCLYLAVARQYDVPLITADKPFRDRVLPFDKRVSLLAGCEGN